MSESIRFDGIEQIGKEGVETFEFDEFRQIMSNLRENKDRDINSDAQIPVPQLLINNHNYKEDLKVIEEMDEVLESLENWKSKQVDELLKSKKYNLNDIQTTSISRVNENVNKNNSDIEELQQLIKESKGTELDEQKVYLSDTIHSGEDKSLKLIEDTYQSLCKEDFCVDESELEEVKESLFEAELDAFLLKDSEYSRSMKKN